MHPTIKKIYVSNFLTGLVFWWGIEKLFMQNIGIAASGIGLITGASLTFNLFGNLPAGILADKWSRKGVLCIGVVSMLIGSLVLGTSHGFWQYLLGYFLYATYYIMTNGTYETIAYDTLYEQGQTEHYSRVTGKTRAYHLYGAAMANILGGFVAHSFGYRLPFFLTLVPYAISLVIILSMYEPTFHKLQQSTRLVREFGRTIKELWYVHLLRSMTILWSGFFVVESFKRDFGQVYMQSYVQGPIVIGLLWAVYAITWAIGSQLGHRLQNRFNLLVWLTVLPLICMSLIHNKLSIILFMVQAITSAALYNQLETRVQHATPSKVRASIMSLLSMSGLASSIPSSLLIGYLMSTFNALTALRVVTFIACLVLIYWMIIRSRLESEQEARRTIVESA